MLIVRSALCRIIIVKGFAREERVVTVFTQELFQGPLTVFYGIKAVI